MGDATLAAEPTRNLVVSSTPPKGAQADASILDHQPSTTSTSFDHPSAEISNMAAVQFVHDQQQSRPGHHLTQSQSMSQRARPAAQQSTQSTFNMSNVQRALPVYSQQQAAHPSQVPQQQHQQQRFQTGPSPAAVAFQLSQQMQHFNGGAPQYYNVGGYQQPYFGPYGPQYAQPLLQQPDQSSQQQIGGGYPVTYPANYPLQYPQSAGPTQTQFVPQWFGQQQVNPYYFMSPTFMSPQMQQQNPQAPSPQHLQGPAASYGRRHSFPVKQSLQKRRGSDSDVAAFSGGCRVPPAWDSRGSAELGGVLSPPKGPAGQHYYSCMSANSTPLSVELSVSSSGGAATSATSLGIYDSTPPPTSLNPSMPRGPPRKPKQSGHALWVGNLPPGTNVVDLKDYFSRDATYDIESVFLISKSNCAFVNYRTDTACNEAMSRFHDSRFQNTRLVCRLRRNSTPATTATANVSPTPAEQPAKVDVEDGDDETDRGVQKAEETHTPIPPIGPAGARAPSREAGGDRIFIVKSLTVEDLDLSVRNGIWATQSHNEATLNQAFEAAENVYLIFSANKSGEYYGYARMTSAISEDPGNSIKWAPSTQPTDDPDLPKAIYTPATETAPQGRIIDDSARGTIFWEAVNDDETSDTEKELHGTESEETAEGRAGVVSKAWGKPFRVEWISIQRVPFYRTRGLRNLWNANREVKIARDGTELEENIGKRLMQMFHRNNSGLVPQPVGANVKDSLPASAVVLSSSGA